MADRLETAKEQRERLRKKRHRLRRVLDKVLGNLKDVGRKIDLIQKIRSHLDQVVGFDGTPVSRGLALMLKDCREHGWSGYLVSGDRREGVAERYGKKSQAFLYRCSQNCVPACGGDCNPANPPNSSTHEYVNGGNGGTPAYSSVPVGAKLDWARLGLDVGESDELIRVAHSLGYQLFRPYPTSSEWHHVNYAGTAADLKKDLIRRGIV